jgi:hypothetical protein
MDFTEVAMLSERAFGKTVAVFAVLDNNGTWLHVMCVRLTV